MTKAQQYLIDRKPDIEINYTENPVSETLEEVFQFLDDSIEKLKPLRLNDTSTKNIVDDLLKTNNNVFIISWLIKGLAHDKSFVYAYNYLAQIRNRENGSVVYPVIIPLDYTEIERLISIEKKKKQNHSKQKSFNCNLNDSQFEILVEHINQVKLFEKEINTKSLKGVFDCNITSPLKVLNVKLLVYLLDALDNNKMVSPEWQAVIGHYNMFISKRGNVISSNNLYSQRSQMLNDFSVPPKGSDIIDKAIKEIKKLKPI